MYLNEIHDFTDSECQVIFGCLIVHKAFGLLDSVTILGSVGFCSFDVAATIPVWTLPGLSGRNPLSTPTRP